MKLIAVNLLGYLVFPGRLFRATTLAETRSFVICIIIHNFSRSVIKTFSLSDPGLKSNAPQSVAITHLNPAKDLRDVLLATLVRQNKAKGVILISSYLSSDSHFCLRALRHRWPFFPFTFLQLHLVSKMLSLVFLLELSRPGLCVLNTKCGEMCRGQKITDIKSR